MSPLLQSLAVVTTRTIENSLIFGGDLKKTTEIMTSVVQEQGVKTDNNISGKDLKVNIIALGHWNLEGDSRMPKRQHIKSLK